MPESDRGRLQDELKQAIDALSEALSIAELNNWDDFDPLDGYIDKLIDLSNMAEQLSA